MKSTKFKTKTEKGITLIALIITIVVLLILAAVAIASIQNDGILTYATNAAKDYNQAVVNEQEILGGYNDFLAELNKKVVEPQIGQYVDYDVSYTDMYNITKTFGATDGWRYLGEDDSGKHLLISTGVPLILNLSANGNENASWWETTSDVVAQGLQNNFTQIPYSKVTAGTTTTSEINTMIGLFGNETTSVIGDYFKAIGKTYQNNISVRTLTLKEFVRAINGANTGVEGYTQIPENSYGMVSGFKNLGGDALELFDLSDAGLLDNYTYWLAYNHGGGPLASLEYVTYSNDSTYDSCSGNMGIRPVIVLPADVQFTDSDSNKILEINQ